ncbi:unnamed protein product [Adineta steineri]|uniref:Transcription initiation factor IIE subunit alpha N-terminal domain-containing protein n=1 Tax=Adineta steineri TaxID=433720 RepID=A0A814RS18_9BILA|nr:unnamed protein product [Adineta steineri]CAF1136511.1 unnamed protein product [Adineta steineri]CAF1143246.1 unnamed protein product [Adineta steineri]
MSLIASGGDSFSNMNSSFPQPTNPSSNDISLLIDDTNDPRAILKVLIRFIMRAFYEVPKSLVIEYIYHYERIKQQDLADLLCLDPKLIRSFIQEFKHHCPESNNDNATSRGIQDQYYYKIDIATFINVVRYRLIHMQMHVENLERQQINKQLNYKCEKCAKEYTDLDIGKLYDFTQDTLICLICSGSVVHEDVETNRQIVNVRLFNEQMKPIYNILKQIDEIMENSSNQNFFQQNGNSSLTSSNHSANNEGISATTHRSHASNIFDRTTAISHEIQIVIENDDDDDR